MSKQNPAKIFVCFLITCLVTACGGGGGGGASGNSATPGSPAPTAAAAPSLTYGAMKTFRFEWTDVSDATHYRLLENPDGASGFSQVGSDITQGTQSIDHIVPLYARLNAQYILQSCNAGGCTDSGAVSVTGSLTDSIGYFKASNTEVADQFGHRVSLSGDGTTLAVTAIGEDSGATGINGDQIDNSVTHSGAVYVFTRSGSAWAQQAYIKASNTDSSDSFGENISLSADGNTLAVAAILERSNATGIDGDQTNNSVSTAGAVYIFSRTGNSWSQQAYVKASNTDLADVFGWAVSLSADGNTLAVGANGEDSAATSIDGNQADNSARESGAVYVFTRSGNSWSQQAYIKGSYNNADDNFGAAVSLSASGDMLAVGATRGDTAGGLATEDMGSVYIFTRNIASWSQQAHITQTTRAGDFFGAAVSLNAEGNWLAVGVPRDDSDATGIGGDSTPGPNINDDYGAVYMYKRTGNLWTAEAYIKASNAGASDNFGSAISLSGDGKSLAVGALNEASIATGIGGDEHNDMGGGLLGAVYLFQLKEGTWSQQAYIKARYNNLHGAGSGYFGQSVSISDNGEALAVGAPTENSDATGVNSEPGASQIIYSGAAYLY